MRRSSKLRYYVTTAAMSADCRVYYAILEQSCIMRGMLCLAVGSIRTNTFNNIGIGAVARPIHRCFYRLRCSRCPNRLTSSNQSATECGFVCLISVITYTGGVVVGHGNAKLYKYKWEFVEHSLQIVQGR